MRYKHFKNADADISALTVGTWGIAGANSAGVTWGDVDTEESIAAIRQMIDNGVNMVDTAPIYASAARASAPYLISFAIINQPPNSSLNLRFDYCQNV